MKPRNFHFAIVVMCWLPPLALMVASWIAVDTAMVVVLVLPLASLSIVGAVLNCADRRGKGRSIAPSLLALAAGLAIIISVAATHWPLRLAFALSRPALGRLADRVDAGEQIAVPLYAGAVRVRHAEVSRHGVVCLWTRVNPAGNTGFVQCPPGHVPFNLWSMIPLDDRWQFISED